MNDAEKMVAWALRQVAAEQGFSMPKGSHDDYNEHELIQLAEGIEKGAVRVVLDATY